MVLAQARRIGWMSGPSVVGQHRRLGLLTGLNQYRLAVVGQWLDRPVCLPRRSGLPMRATAAHVLM